MIILFANSAFAIERKSLNTDFFTKFNDDNLIYYINLAIDNNHNAKQATQKVEQFRQQMKFSFAKELPTFSVSADYLGINSSSIR